ncbi:MAG: hypothetical protein JXL97_07575 [Bacteroidales bacterium]|nr:hypothetical protein [Bacteroidales bacterium]
MKRILLVMLVFASMILFSCKNESANDENNSSDNNTEVTDNNGKTNEPSVEIEMLEFDPSIVNKLSGIKGALQYGYKWKDKAGYNLLIFTRATAFKQWEDADYDGMGDNFVYLKVYHFSGTEESYSLVRLVQDGETEGCGDPPFAIDCDFYDKSISITDLDKDGYAEATFMYYILCASEITPVPTKLIMIENGEKYAIRGDSYLMEIKMGGEKDIDFGNAPDQLLDFASQTWDKFCASKP